MEKAAPTMTLKEIYEKFKAKTPEMDGRTFFKLMKDSKMLDTKLTQTNVDLTFSKCADLKKKKMSFEQFKLSLVTCAGYKKITPEDFEKQLIEGASSAGPLYKGTKAQSTALHDDKSKYTGVHAHGGPSTVDKDKISSISQTCDRTEADERGVKK
jgi:folate-dependent phosphoribosylglycinamide formyltransferase PurN